jgi:3-hydroxybutyrate dehydrogenase
VFSQNGGDVYFQYYQNEKRAHELEERFSAKAVRIDFLRDEPLPNRNFDIVVNNAGINITKSVALQVTPEEWQRTIKINLDTPYRVTLKYLPYMIENKWGRIINISSIFGVRATTNNLPYNVSKHGLAGFTKSIAKEYAPYRITCNEICPGTVESELMERIAERKEGEFGISREEYFRSIRESIPTKRFAKPMEIATLALYLASDYAAQINGTSIVVDGGAIA